MSIVKLIDSRFPFPQNLTGLIKYIFNDDETATRSHSYLRYLIFVSPDIVDVQAPGRIQRTVELICHNHALWNVPYGPSLAHHMVVSFADAEINNPNDAWWLGVQISQGYFKKGYINCFAVHTSTDNLHLHFAIDNISFETGQPFYIPNEAVALRQQIDEWISNYLSGSTVPLSSCR